MLVLIPRIYVKKAFIRSWGLGAFENRKSFNLHSIICPSNDSTVSPSSLSSRPKNKAPKVQEHPVEFPIKHVGPQSDHSKIKLPEQLLRDLLQILLEHLNVAAG